MTWWPTISPFSQSTCSVCASELSDVRENGTLPLKLCVGRSWLMPRLTHTFRICSSRVNLMALVIRFFSVSYCKLVTQPQLTMSICKTRVGSSDTSTMSVVLHESSSRNCNSMLADFASPSNIFTASLAIDWSCTSTGVITNKPESSLDMVSTSAGVSCVGQNNNGVFGIRYTINDSFHMLGALNDSFGSINGSF